MATTTINDLFAQLQAAVDTAQTKQAIRGKAVTALDAASQDFDKAQAEVEALRSALNTTLGELLPTNPRVTISR